MFSLKVASRTLIVKGGMNMIQKATTILTLILLTLKIVKTFLDIKNSRP